MTGATAFPYDLAFARNLGWLAEWEQLALRAKRVAIAGMGGVGGAYLLALARFGIGSFTIADFDTFEFANFNRQVGATVATVGRPKVEVMAEMARAINPELHLRCFDRGVSAAGVDDFLAGAHVFVDGFDFFELELRRRVFARCAELGIPAITAAPIGMGVGLLIFAPGGLTFEEYFRFAGQPEGEQYLRFLMGLVPRGLHRPYLVDPTRLDLSAHRGPSTAAACELCTGVTAVAAVKLLLGRGGVDPAPWYHQFDAYRSRFVRGRLPAGNAGLSQRLKLALARRMYGRAAQRRSAPAPIREAPRSPIEEILNLARWAPSGDNTQPWRFRILDADTVLVELRPPPPADIYEYRNGAPTWLSGGMLLESMRIAASFWGRSMLWQRETDGRLRVQLPRSEGLPVDPLHHVLTLRSVDRRSFYRRRLSEGEKSELAEALGGRLELDWHESALARMRVARLNAAATRIRLSIREAFEVHRRVIDWERSHSPDGIPAAATGLGAPTRVLMRWALQSWQRTRLVNRLGGPSFAALELDYRTAIGSAGFFCMRWPADVASEGDPDELLHAGEAIQRFWLTATRLGLAIQPSIATLIFAWYGYSGTNFTSDTRQQQAARSLGRAFLQTLGISADQAVFLGRIGEPSPRLPAVRSTRLPLEQLVQLASSAPAGHRREFTDPQS